MHVFGLTMAMSILFYRFFINYKKKKYQNCKIDILFSVILLALFLTNFYLATSNPSNLEAIGWIEVKLWYFGVFTRWTINTIIFILMMSALLLYHHRSEIFKLDKIKLFFLSDFTKNILNISIPSLILVVITLLISIKIPVLNYRNLIVVFPAGVLIAAVMSINFLKLKFFYAALFIFFTLLTYININFYFKPMTKTTENIEWVIKKTYTKECENAAVYLNDRNKESWDMMVGAAINTYAKYYRPLKRLTEFNEQEFIQEYKKYNKCKVFIASFHYDYFDTYVKELDKYGFNLNIIYAPNVLDRNSNRSGAITRIE